MSVVKRKGNMYEFVTHMWAPVKGTCMHVCSYCYMRGRRFELGELRINEKDLKNNLGKDRFIFVCHTADLFAANVPSKWIIKVLEHCCKYTKNRYLFQTKNPARMLNFIELFPTNSLYGTTIETDREDLVVSKAPCYRDRAIALQLLAEEGCETIVTIEPILKFTTAGLVELVKIASPKWVNIGADSKNHDLPEPTENEIKELINVLKKETTVELKRNLDRILKDLVLDDN